MTDLDAFLFLTVLFLDLDLFVVFLDLAVVFLDLFLLLLLPDLFSLSSFFFFYRFPFEHTFEDV